MKYFGKRGQGAMEYLMTYGWAILVVMVVGIVMWQMGLFNIGGGTATTASGFPRIKPLLATAVYDSSDDTFLMSFTNGAGGTIISITPEIDCGGSEGTFVTVSTPIRSGDNFDLDCTDSGVTISQGDPYVCEISFDYTVNVAGQSVARTDVGVVRGPAD